ncbi:MAG TPA: ATP-binding protein [Candidatus Saccharibacteria bacterium]|nr:ATP-binding protein [Candidatus Saccharibacteria bacterium]
MAPKHHLFRYLPLLISTGVALLLFTLSPVVHSVTYNLKQTIIDPNAPVDVCPNIDGIQVVVPDGMGFDDDGNCFTPEPEEPPIPPVTTDLCRNIDGLQTVLPNGYYRTTASECFPQPSEPVDICPNINGVQVMVPEGYYLDTDNQCYKLPPLVDVCPNIDGPQAVIPEGMIKKDDLCYTPEPSETPITPNPDPNTGSGSTGPTLPNIPDAFVPFVQPFVDVVPEPLKKWLQNLPPTVAKTAPYYIFGVVGLLALGVFLQALREAEFTRQLLILLRRERDIAEQKDMFVMLASHYLRTPLTVMNGGIDTAVALRQLSNETVQPIKYQLTELKNQIDTILSTIQNNATLHDINSAASNTAPLSIRRSPFFWGPLVGSIVLTLLANFLFGVVGNQIIGTDTLAFQAIFAAAVIVVLYLAVRNLFVKRQLRNRQRQLIDHEQAVDDARNSLIAQATETLQQSLAGLNANKHLIESAPSAYFFNEGHKQFQEILDKFLLLSYIQAGTERSLEAIDIRSMVSAVLARYQNEIAAKNLSVTNSVESTTIYQNRKLFDFVITSLIDNAIKFNQDGGSIVISTKPSLKTLSIRVDDSGIGIDDAKLSQLFRPFTRATSVTEFNYEGLGFSLFLDRLIMKYTDGTIRISSTPNRGTASTVTIPRSTQPTSWQTSSKQSPGPRYKGDLRTVKQG